MSLPGLPPLLKRTLLQPIGRDLATLAKEDEIIGTIPVLDDLQAVLDLATQGLPVKVLTEKNRLHSLAQLDDGAVGGVLELTMRKALEDGLRICSPQSEGGGVLDHLVVLSADQVPADRPRQDRLEVWIGVG